MSAKTRRVRVFDLIEPYGLHSLIAKGSLQQLQVAIRVLEKCRGALIFTHELKSELVLSLMRKLAEKGRSARTVNGKRDSILLLWRFAYEKRRELRCRVPTPPGYMEVRKMRVLHRNPDSWTRDEVKLILESCKHEPTIRGWTPFHWQVLVLLVWYTALRLGAILSAASDQLLKDDRLIIYANQQKQKRETIHKIPAFLANALRSMSGTFLLDWPLGRRQIWLHFNRILDRAGLPKSRKKFHRLRASSYTEVYLSLGPEAAKEHAGHLSVEMGRFYLDRTRLPIVDVTKSIPRLRLE